MTPLVVDPSGYLNPTTRWDTAHRCAMMSESPASQGQLPNRCGARRVGTEEPPCGALRLPMRNSSDP